MTRSRIKVLDPQTVAQIAAGEVVERPASVVKELVENSLDAQASKIFVTLENAGLSKIQVVDNGFGLTKEEAELAFARYATSKITKIEDLEQIETLGFRGEALPSIAAVAEIEFITRAQGTEAGTYLALENGRVRERREFSRAVGTTVIVKNLFKNVPARKKFLKSQRIELTHIIDVVTRYALIHYNKTFKLVHNGKEIFFSPQTRSILETVTTIYGKDYARALLPINYSNDFMQISGFVSNPSLTRATSSHQSIYINTRYVTSRLISDAIRDSYYRLILKGRYPIAIMAIKINPKLIDVNVHPTKSQVKFSEELKVYDAVVQAVKQALAAEPLIPELRKEELALPKVEPKAKEFRIFKPQYLPVEDKKILEVEERKLPPVRIVGQILDTYLVIEAPNALMLIDQHAAHERIMLEKLTTEFLKKDIQTQELLEPLIIELSPKEDQALKHFAPALKELGFTIESFGKSLYKLRALPVMLSRLSRREDFLDALDELTHMDKPSTLEDSKKKILELLACKSAIKANEKLSIQAMEKLVRELNSLAQPYTCAHGRPTLISLSKKELEKLFKRT